MKEREIIETRLRKCIQSSILFGFDPSRAAKRKPQPEESKVQRRERSMCVQKFRTFISSTTSLWGFDTSQELGYVRSEIAEETALKCCILRLENRIKEGGSRKDRIKMKNGRVFRMEKLWHNM